MSRCCRLHIFYCFFDKRIQVKGFFLVCKLTCLHLGHIEQIGDEEAVVCYDADTGKERWSYSYAARFSDPTGDGPRATPTVAAFTAATGEILREYDRQRARNHHGNSAAAR